MGALEEFIEGARKNAYVRIVVFATKTQRAKEIRSLKGCPVAQLRLKACEKSRSIAILCGYGKQRFGLSALKDLWGYKHPRPSAWAEQMLDPLGLVSFLKYETLTPGFVEMVSLAALAADTQDPLRERLLVMVSMGA